MTAARVSALLLGLLAGGMLLIAVAIVPFWRALPPAEFRAWFAANSFRIGALMVPLGAGAAVASVTALVVGGGLSSRAWRLAAAAGAVGVVVVTLTVNEPANVRFASAGALGDDDTRALLARWVVWHWIRVALGGGGFYAALRALE